MSLDKWQEKLAGGIKNIPQRRSRARYSLKDGEIPLDRLRREVDAAFRKWEKRASVSLKTRPVNSSAK
jgi:hypothetical protein